MLKIVVPVISLIIIVFLISNNNVHVNSYTKSDGTFVKEHYRSKP